ncbi:DNA-directed RNA polymerase subunit omega [Vermiculatibacterium agrestimuris]|uniref:DNA-directed RNA polymerase subunit omega n=1 Tax=Vermiculatibacterium agrestimuris TaxID=2941519 RepID=UPI00203AB15B|nr:DNA-directed RNA polymerase subunit omega [Vermiculatibacterium agrestimuris]
MNLYPMDKLLKDVPSRYMLVNVVAHRARQIASTAEDEGYPLEEKPVTLALDEVVSGKLELTE